MYNYPNRFGCGLYKRPPSTPFGRRLGIISGKYGTGLNRRQYSPGICGAGWWDDVKREGVLKYFADKVETCMEIGSALMVAVQIGAEGLSEVSYTDLITLAAGGYASTKAIISTLKYLLTRGVSPRLRRAYHALIGEAENGAERIDNATRQLQIASGQAPIGAAAQAERDGITNLPPQAREVVAAIQEASDDSSSEQDTEEAKIYIPVSEVKTKRKYGAQKRTNKNTGRKIGKHELDDLGITTSSSSSGSITPLVPYRYIDDDEYDQVTYDRNGVPKYPYAYGRDKNIIKFGKGLADPEQQYGHMWSIVGQPYTCNCDYNYYDYSKMNGGRVDPSTYRYPSLCNCQYNRYPPPYGNGFLGNVFKTIKNKAMPVLKQLF